MTVIALLTLDIHIPHAQSLKDKRMIVRRLKDRLRSKFNVAVSEVEHQELWQRSQLRRSILESIAAARFGRSRTLSAGVHDSRQY